MGDARFPYYIGNFHCGTFLSSMPPPANLSITPPDPPPLLSELPDPDAEDPTTPKASQAPQLNLIPDSPTSSSSMPPPPIPSRGPKNTSLGLSVSTLPPQQRPRQKVVLAPGFSPLDWARLKSSGTDLRVSNPPLAMVLMFRILKRRIYYGFLLQNLNAIVVGTMPG